MAPNHLKTFAHIFGGPRDGERWIVPGRPAVLFVPGIHNPSELTECDPELSRLAGIQKHEYRIRETGDGDCFAYDYVGVRRS